MPSLGALFPACDTHAGTLALLYFGYGLTHVFLIIGTSIYFTLLAVRASRTLHRDTVRRLLYAPLWWYDATPSGRILSRFTADLAAVDLHLASDIDNVLQMVAMILVLTGYLPPPPHPPALGTSERWRRSSMRWWLLCSSSSASQHSSPIGQFGRCDASPTTRQVSNKSRTSLEQVSNKSRTSLEDISKTSRRRLEDVSNSPFVLSHTSHKPMHRPPPCPMHQYMYTSGFFNLTKRRCLPSCRRSAR